MRGLIRLAGGATAALVGAVSGCSEAPEGSAPDPPALETSAGEGPVRIRAAVDRAAVTTPEEFALTIETEVGLGVVAALGVAGLEEGDSLGEFTVLDHRSSGPRLLDSGRVRTRRTLVLEPFLPGQYEIPALEVAYRSGEGAAGRVSTEPMGVRVESVLGAGDELDVGELRGLAALPEPEGFPWTALFLAVSGTIGAIVGGLGFLWWMDRRRRTRSAFDDAAERIATLREQSPADEPGCRAAWDECGRLVIECISERLEPEAPHLTGAEIARRAHSWFGIPDPDRQRLRALLDRMELVRFGGERAEAENTRAMLIELEDLLERVRDASDMVVVEREAAAS